MRACRPLFTVNFLSPLVKQHILYILRANILGARFSATVIHSDGISRHSVPLTEINICVTPIEARQSQDEAE